MFDVSVLQGDLQLTSYSEIQWDVLAYMLHLCCFKTKRSLNVISSKLSG